MKKLMIAKGNSADLMSFENDPLMSSVAFALNLYQSGAVNVPNPAMVVGVGGNNGNTALGYSTNHPFKNRGTLVSYDTGSANNYNRRYITVPVNSSLPGDFCIEFWRLRYANLTTTDAYDLYNHNDTWQAGDMYFGFYTGYQNKDSAQFNGFGGIGAPANWVLNKWVHECWERVGTTMTWYKNGTACATKEMVGAMGNTKTWKIGRALSWGDFSRSLIAQPRITRAKRYGGNFVIDPAKYNI